MSTHLARLNERIKIHSEWVDVLRLEMGRVIIGQRYLIDRLIIGLITNGHVLLEGVPGLAKTLSVRTLAAAIQAQFRRIQFTPDLLPADIVGTLIYNPQEGAFTTKKGPVFANILLADEVNRAPAKVQSALLEAMQERQVTLGDRPYQLPDPFLVLATENPIDQQGTYQLPEAQVDRFMLKLKLGYPSPEEERRILDSMAAPAPDTSVSAVIDLKRIIEARGLVGDVYIDDTVKDYIVAIVLATRRPEGSQLDLSHHLQYGASPRATIALTLAARAWAFLQGRGYVTPQDVKAIGMDVLRHRLTLTYEAEAEDVTSEALIQKIFDTLPVP